MSPNNYCIVTKESSIWGVAALFCELLLLGEWRSKQLPLPTKLFYGGSTGFLGGDPSQIWVFTTLLLS